MRAHARQGFRVAAWAWCLAALLVPALTPSCALVAESGAQVEIALRVDGTGGQSLDRVQLSELAGRLHIENASLVSCDEASADQPSARRPSARQPSGGPPGAAAHSAKHFDRHTTKHLDKHRYMHWDMHSDMHWGLRARAYALHGDGNGNALSTSVVAPLAAGDPTPLGRLDPPAGRYCALELTLTPSPALDNWTLELGGRADGQRFVTRAYTMGRWRLSLAAPLALTGQSTHRLEVVVDLGGAASAVRFGDPDHPDLGPAFMSLIESNVQAEMRGDPAYE